MLFKLLSMANGLIVIFIINKVTGTYGSRTLNDIYLCAHTTNRNNENGALLIDLDKMDFRLIRISGTRY